MGVIGRGRRATPKMQPPPAVGITLLAGPVGVMLVRHQMLGQLCRVTKQSVPTRVFASRSMTRYQYMSLWPKPIFSSHGEHHAAAKSKGYAN